VTFDSGLLAELNIRLNSISNKKKLTKKKKEQRNERWFNKAKQKQKKPNQNSCPLDLKKITLIPALHYPLKHFLYASQ